MSEDSLNRICTQAPRLAAEFKQIAGRLKSDNQTETAHWYRGGVKHISASVHREARSLRRLLAVDSDVLDHLIGFGVAAVRMREGEADGDVPPPRPLDLVSDFAHGLRSHLRRGPMPHWAHDLATLVIIEATNSMRRSLRLPHGIRVNLRITLPDGRPIEFQTDALSDSLEDATSSENLTEADALPS
jgi:hypothetical protein